MQYSPQQIKIETLILVAVWSKPAIFQGCFKISPIDAHRTPIFLFFRCEYENHNRENFVGDSFSTDEYHFSHLYNEIHAISLEEGSEGMEYAKYILQYALYKTLLKMRTHQKLKFTLIDDEAMKSIIKKVEPMLLQEGIWEMPDEHIGFAVTIDFHPQEKMGELAVNTLLNLGAPINTYN